MRPVLLRVTRACESPWVPVGQASQVRVHGLAPKTVVLLLFSNGTEPLALQEDGLYDLPPEAGAVKARVKSILHGQVSVDLE